MSNNHITSLDLNLLPVFRLLMRECSVSEAARHLGVGQPAVSRSLARLRAAFDDPLFVRRGRVMEPTPRALRLFEELAPAFDRIEQALRGSHGFDPQTSDHVFRIAMSDDLQLSALPAIRKTLLETMPRARMIVEQTDYLRAQQKLDRGEASITMGYLDKLPANAKVKKVARVGYRMVMSKATKAPTSLRDYCARPHILVTFAGDLIGYIDETLTGKSMERRIVMSVPTFAVLPFLLSDSEMIATVPLQAAKTLAAYDHLHAADLPFASPAFNISMAWRAASDRDPAEVLFREIIEQEVRRVAA